MNIYGKLILGPDSLPIDLNNPEIRQRIVNPREDKKEDSKNSLSKIIDHTFPSHPIINNSVVILENKKDNPIMGPYFYKYIIDHCFSRIQNTEIPKDQAFVLEFGYEYNMHYFNLMINPYIPSRYVIIANDIDNFRSIWENYLKGYRILPVPPYDNCTRIVLYIWHDFEASLYNLNYENITLRINKGLPSNEMEEDNRTGLRRLISPPSDDEYYQIDMEEDNRIGIRRPEPSSASLLPPTTNVDMKEIQEMDIPKLERRKRNRNKQNDQQRENRRRLLEISNYLNNEFDTKLMFIHINNKNQNEIIVYSKKNDLDHIDSETYEKFIHLMNENRTNDYLFIKIKFIRNGQKLQYTFRPGSLQNEFVIYEDVHAYWEQYEDKEKDPPIPLLEWVTSIKVSIVPNQYANIPNNGGLFPFSLKYDASELLVDVEKLGVYCSNVYGKVSEEDIKTENCFLKSLQVWNEWLKNGSYKLIYNKGSGNKWVRKYEDNFDKNIIPESTINSIKGRLFGKTVSKKTINQICKEYNLLIKMTTIVYKPLNELSESRLNRTVDMIEMRHRNDTSHLKDLIRKNNIEIHRSLKVETYGKIQNTNTKQIQMGLIMYGIYGHYFADIDLNMSKNGIENYYDIYKKGGKRSYSYRERITGSYEKEDKRGYCRFRCPKEIKISENEFVYAAFKPAHMVLDYLICTPDEKSLLTDIPHKLKYYIMPEEVSKLDINNIDIWNEDCELLKYKEKTNDNIYLVADTECVVGERHFPYIISWCVLGEDGKNINYKFGWNCIDRFISWFKFDKTIMDKAMDGKTGKQIKKVIVYFHNLSYDGRLFADQEIRSINMNGNKIIQMDIAVTPTFVIRLRDSLMLIPSKLANFPKMFKTKEKSKQLFPYTFVTESVINNIIENDKKMVLLTSIYGSQKWNMSQQEEFKQTCIDNNCLDISNDKIDIFKLIKVYVMSDVKILSQGMKIFSEKVKDTLNLNLLNYISISSLAHAYMTREAYDGENIYTYKGETRDYIRRAVTGGRCMTSQNMSWKVENTPILDVDACSLYPSAMSKMKIPKGKPKKYIPMSYKEMDDGKYFSDHDKNIILSRINLRDDDKEKINAVIIRIRIRKIGVELDFPLIYEKDDRGVLNYVNKVNVDMTVDDTTLTELIKWQKIEFDIYECIYWNQGYSNKINGVISRLYNERKKAKEENNIIQEVYKLIMNSCYGKCIEKPHLKKYVIVTGEEQMMNHQFTHYLKINKIIEIKGFSKECRLKEIEDEMVDCESEEVRRYLENKKQDIIEGKNKNYIFEEYVDYDDFAAPVMIGVKVLSESKRIMNSVMCSAQMENIRIYYQDTDSMHLEKHQLEDLEKAWRKHNNKSINEKLYGSDMCQFHSDFEKINGKDTYSCYSIFLGKKMYMDLLIPHDISFDGNIEAIEDKSKVMCRLKGIPSKSIEEYYDGTDVSDVQRKISIYENLFNEGELVFDLVQGGKIIGFTKDLEIVSLKEFDRKIKRPNVPRCFVYEGEIVEYENE